MNMTRVTVGTLRRQLGDWEKGSGASYKRLAEGLRLLILDGRLPLDHRLPGERRLADGLGVSRTTVTAALTELKDAGFLRSRHGSGTTTSHPVGPAAQEVNLLTREEQAGVLDLSAATMPANEHVHGAYAKALHALPSHLPRHGYAPVGLVELRSVLAQRYTDRGLPTAPDEIMVTAGAQNALALLLHALARPGRAVLVEQPTYPHAIQAIRQAGCRPRPAPLLPDGWDGGALLEAVGRSDADITYLVPDHQNPTGLVMPEALRAQLARAINKSEGFLVVDETLTDLWFDEPPPSPSPETDGPRVIRTGSMAKSFWGGLRLGWIRAAREVIAAVARTRTAMDLGVPVLEQLAAAHLLAAERNGLDERRAQLRGRYDHLSALLSEQLPTWRHVRPKGGLALWLEMDRPVASRLAAACDELGLRIAAGPRFGVDGTLERFVRLAFGRSEAELTRAVPILAQACTAVETRKPIRREREPAPVVL